MTYCIFGTYSSTSGLTELLFSYHVVVARHSAGYVCRRQLVPLRLRSQHPSVPSFFFTVNPFYNTVTGLYGKTTQRVMLRFFSCRCTNGLMPLTSVSQCLANPFHIFFDPRRRDTNESAGNDGLDALLDSTCLLATRHNNFIQRKLFCSPGTSVNLHKTFSGLSELVQARTSLSK